jgi:hypothetical protein
MPITSMRYGFIAMPVESFVKINWSKTLNNDSCLCSFAGINVSLNQNSMESLILAQDERWRRA